MRSQRNPCRHVDEALEIQDEALRQKLEQAMAALHTIEECIGLPKIPVIEADSEHYSGAFRYDPGRLRADHIILASDLDPNRDFPLIAFIHEAGHHIDFHATGVSGVYVSESPRGAAWYREVCVSDTFKELSAVLKTRRNEANAFVRSDGIKILFKVLKDSLTRHELFAHSFVFYVAIKSENSALLQELSRLGQSLDDRAHFAFWGTVPCSRASIERDFGKIASAIEQILERP